MANDLAALKAKIAEETGNRTDLDAAIASRIPRAIEFYADQEFAFSTGPQLGRATVNATAGYAYVSLPAGVRVVERVFLVDGLQADQLDQIVPHELEERALDDATLGRPDVFAWVGSNLRLHQTPQNAYPLVFVGTFDQTQPLVQGTDANCWTVDGQELIAARVRIWLNRDVLRDMEGLSAAKDAEREALAVLRDKTTKRLATGRNRLYL